MNINTVDVGGDDTAAVARARAQAQASPGGMAMENITVDSSMPVLAPQDTNFLQIPNDSSARLSPYTAQAQAPRSLSVPLTLAQVHGSPCQQEIEPMGPNYTLSSSSSSTSESRQNSMDSEGSQGSHGSGDNSQGSGSGSGSQGSGSGSQNSNTDMSDMVEDELEREALEETERWRLIGEVMASSERSSALDEAYEGRIVWIHPFKLSQGSGSQQDVDMEDVASRDRAGSTTSLTSLETIVEGSGVGSASDEISPDSFTSNRYSGSGSGRSHRKRPSEELERDSDGPSQGGDELQDAGASGARAGPSTRGPWRRNSTPSAKKRRRS